jgi:hypothetical protein
VTHDPDPNTEELRIAQADTEQLEAVRADEADLAEDERTHERRSDKAGYLRERLEEQQAADAARDD